MLICLLKLSFIKLKKKPFPFIFTTKQHYVGIMCNLKVSYN